MLDFLRKLIPDRHPIRLFYHKFVAVLAAVVFWFPASKLIVIGVTGTNGKTTTVNFIARVLENAGNKVGLASTINFQVGNDRWVNASKQSTISPFKLQKLLRRMVREGCKYAVLEVTSHAVTQSRIIGINFDVAVLTNIMEDHIEYHGSFNAYINAKGGLFEKVSRGLRKPGIPKVTVLNADDKYYSYFDQFAADRKITYGMGDAVVYAAEIKMKPMGSSFVLHIPNHAVEVNLKMPGEFNVYNALATASVCLTLGVPVEKIKEGLELAGSVSGRFERVLAGQDFEVIVDYAHAPDSMENLLKMYRGLTSGRLFSVFGATGGGRDKGKRPKMGAVAHEYADYVIVTNDDPYVEDELTIIDQVSEGIPRVEGQNFWKIPDRREAIKLALSLAKKDDAVVISGKGCEEIMIVRGKKVPWNDRKVVEDLLGLKK
ncbi:UDP-N-acetylmuramoyl-L-alanyl-D-glutamate--2,6-diaminopimelate ligase [Candidatus Peregrinibacteria bacterium CG10_big_fil_rev_8_21_14_0_10_36_19]|nr:MAG: UDP-N-acetylmuramoyl-L-alanyl-D-glutamate--2,6-diaminopimelate ligase [Candidatus Peregrinibacteria bacterium CG10_big_fil_rev_8_21_14_0_10_36_19]